MFYFDILKAFYQMKVKYLITGGLAVNLFGVPRVTHDLDVILSMDEGNILLVLKILNKLGYKPRLPVDPKELLDEQKVENWIQNKNMFAFSFCQPENEYQVLVILIHHPLDFEKSFEKKVVKTAKNIDICLVAMDDLILMKEFSGRDQDLSDISLLRKAREFMGQDND